jgi:hypothetical protein
VNNKKKNYTQSPQNYLKNEIEKCHQEKGEDHQIFDQRGDPHIRGATPVEAIMPNAGTRAARGSWRTAPGWLMADRHIGSRP